MTAARALRAAAAAWLAVTALGQLVFVVYLLGFYGRLTLAGRFADWNRGVPHGYVADEPFGNLVVGLHLGFAVLVMAGGALQLIPTLRRRRPAFHRWNGRVYLAAAVITSVGGLIMMATRGTFGGPWQKIATCLNGAVIVGCAGMAWRHARARRFDAHRRWALRLFLAAGGVWFNRVVYNLWVAALGPVGFDPSEFRGPFLTFLNFAQFLVPLGVLELYLRAQRRGAPAQHAVAALLAALSAVTAAGVVAVTIRRWLPYL